MKIYLRRKSIKRNVFSPCLISLALCALCILASFFVSCNNGFSPGGGKRSNDPVWTDVVYSNDGNTVTVFIGEGAGRLVSPQQAGFDSEGRALNLPLAQLGHDFFEVVFLCNINGTPADHSTGHVVSRASWQRGQRARVSGVYRGVNYGNVTYAPAAGAGSAVLFVGNKSDNTLLAVGRISHIDDLPVAPAAAVIETSTKSVTFTVEALKSSVSRTPAESSFLTATNNTPDFLTVSEANTRTAPPRTIAGKSFPFFDLERGVADLRTHYLFETDTATDNFGAYTNAIILSAKGKVDKIEPRYSTPEGNIRKDSNVFLDKKTEITLPNHDDDDLNLPFKNPVVFSLNTVATDEGAVFALVFEIPVIALSSLESPLQWHIRPGYGTYLYDLDDGDGSAGGAVLLGNGFVMQGGFGTRLVVVTPPKKYQYNYWSTVTNDIVYERFSFEGLKVELQDINHNPIRDIETDDPNLVFLIGGYPVPNPFEFRQFYGLVWIQIAYDDPFFSGYRYQGDPFPVLVSAKNIYVTGVGLATSNDTNSNRYFNFTDYAQSPIHTNAAADGFVRRQVRGAGGTFAIGDSPSGIRIYILDGGNVSIPDPTLNNNMPYLLMFISTGDNILGRGTSNQVLFNHNNFASYNQIYFGPWPFPEPLTLPPAPAYWSNGNTGGITTVNYRLNAGGAATDTAFSGSATATNFMFSGFNSGRLNNVSVRLPAENVAHRNWLH